MDYGEFWRFSFPVPCSFSLSFSERKFNFVAELQIDFRHDGIQFTFLPFMFHSLIFNFVSILTQTYWWACTLMLFGGVLFMAAFIKCCAVHTPSSNPKRKKALRLSETLRRPADTLRRKVSFWFWLFAFLFLSFSLCDSNVVFILESKPFSTTGVNLQQRRLTIERTKSVA